MEDFVTLVSLTPKKIYKEQLKLKKGKMNKKERLHIKRAFFPNKVLFGFDDDIILQLGDDILTFKDVFHDIDSRLNLF
jgi:predicted secreted acid phosphatase